MTSVLTVVCKQHRPSSCPAALGRADASPEVKTISVLAHIFEPLLGLLERPQMCLTTTVAVFCGRKGAVSDFLGVCRRHGAFSPASALGWASALPQVDVLDAAHLPRHLTCVCWRMQMCLACICSVLGPISDFLAHSCLQAAPHLLVPDRVWQG